MRVVEAGGRGVLFFRAEGFLPLVGECDREKRERDAYLLNAKSAASHASVPTMYVVAQDSEVCVPCVRRRV